MKNIILSAAIASILACAPALAATPEKGAKKNDCPSSPWPLSRTVSIEQLMADFQELPRELVIQYAFGEIVGSEKDSLDVPLLRYLYGSEANNSLRGFFGAIPYLVYGEDVKTLMENWPQRPRRLAKMSPARLCQLYRDTLKDRK